MATATQKLAPMPARPKPPKAEYRCECGHALRVLGSGRHRVYFEQDNDALDAPVMDRACPACGRGLPGRNAH